MMEIYRPCPVCRSEVRPYWVHRQNFVLPEGHILPDWYDLVTCSKCGFLYADTFASQDTYDKYYEKMSMYYMPHSETDSDNSMYVDRAAWIKTFIRNTTNSIIDIGCGNGQLLSELRNIGLSDLTGLDPSEKCILNLQKKGIIGIKSSIFSVSLNRKYDCAILSGVLEHIYDVEKIMETMKKLLRHQGLLFVFVPDASRYTYYDSVPYDYFNIEHINHFDETSLINLGLQHGFCVKGFLKTTITLSKTTQPVIFCIYEDQGNPSTNWNSYSRNYIAEYIEHTKRTLVIDKLINQLVETQEEIVVWGAGNFSSRLLATSELGKCNIVFFVDNDKHKQGSSLGCRMVYAPSVIKKMAADATILIVAAVFQEEIIAEARNLGLNNKVIILNER